MTALARASSSSPSFHRIYAEYVNEIQEKLKARQERCKTQIEDRRLKIYLLLSIMLHFTYVALSETKYT
jgi:hypothetical protein